MPTLPWDMEVNARPSASPLRQRFADGDPLSGVADVAF